MSFARKHKISLIIGIPLTGTEKIIFDFFSTKLNNLTQIIDNRYPDSLFYVENGKVLLEQDLKGNKLLCSHNDICLTFDKYDMKYSDRQYIIKYIVEKAFKTKVGIPIRYMGHGSDRWRTLIK